MAVVKIKYTRKREAIKAHIRYITHRRGGEEKTISRLIFGQEGTIDKEAAYRLIDEARPGTVFYKVIISPDPKREDSRRDLDLWQLTRYAAASLTRWCSKAVVWLWKAIDLTN
jgi:hypothetical protein